MGSAGLITRQLDEIHAMFAGLGHGEVATYIPELSHANPELFGIAVASRNGGVYTSGDADSPFTIQSISKPFVYALALADHGREHVLSHVGAEPSGEAFNAISLDAECGRPANPMINAGAIVTTSLISANTPEARFERILDTLSAFAGHPLDVDEDVYRSELATGDRNRALAYLMRGAGSLNAAADETLDVYFRQCSVLVTARDIAVMAATLANGGTHPITGRSIVPDDVASQVLTIMATCGMYNYSGEWLLRAGLPAKSGVAGGVVAASPAHFGLGLFSPPLDRRGNSIRAIAACQELSDRFDLHLMRQPNRPTPNMYHHSLAERPSSAWNGDKRVEIRVIQGDVGFADAEILLRSVDHLLNQGPAMQAASCVVLDLSGVRSMCRAAAAMVSGIERELSNAGVDVAVVASDSAIVPAGATFPSVDRALDWWADMARHRDR